MKILKIALSAVAVAGLSLHAADPTPQEMRTQQGLESYDAYCLKFTQLKTNGFKDPQWYEAWKSAVSDKPNMEAPRYYLRVRSNVTDENYDSGIFPNVARVKRILTKEKFEKMFPNSKSSTGIRHTNLKGTKLQNGLSTNVEEADLCWHPGTLEEHVPLTKKQLFSYENFLKAVALLPGYCGDYNDYPDPVLAPILQQRADLIARKLLACTFAHAVQETSDSGEGAIPTLAQKLPGTFANVIEGGDGSAPLCPDGSGIFSRYQPNPDPKVATKVYAPGKFAPLVLTGENQGDKKVAHVYAGRGIKQTTYPTNYANASFFLFGDLRLLAYPELFEQPGVMAFLGGLTYALIPKDGNPSIAEVMDGSFSRKLDEATSSGGSVAGTFKKTYDLEFPLTILLVNGGPECNGNKNIPAANIPLNNNNTKIRLEAYNYFVATSDLLAPVKVGALPAEAPAFNAKAGDATGIEPEEYAATDANGKPNGAHYLPKSEDPLSPPNDNYNLTGNLDSCLKLMVGAINAKPPAKDYAGFVADPATKKMTPQEFTDAKLTERAASPDWQAAIYNGDYVVVGGDVWQSNDNKPASVGKFTKISFTPWTSLFDRAIYYGPNWNKTACVVTGSADGMPIFGGAPVKKLIDDANFAKK